MFSSVRNFFHTVRGERWKASKVSGDIEYRLVFNRSDELMAVVLRHLPTYEKSNIADVMGSLQVDISSGQWSELVGYARSNGEAHRQPFDFYFDRERDRVFYTLDGAIFSIPRVSVEEIDARLTSLR